ncbi:hypothetical protein FNV43_RR17182 [Rhamnella rubrinervis]|uniref:HTH myb-type domain-containing protein n=1 Tax=Rhamnella rubrinervis TaxID=2594499 RepID=A0A8K0E8W6_9ROSA|nr:hypothetical protein FNV43_RR17182 [Rhamnella rubrinervis]
MELSLDSSLVSIPSTISDFIAEVSTIRDSSEKLAKLDDYAKRLEEERKKIDAFKRELPLCMILLNDGGFSSSFYLFSIGRLKEEAIQLKDGPVIEEFIPLKRNSGGEDGGVNSGDDSSDKRNWMSSAQLWSTNIDPSYKKQDSVSELKLRSEEDDRSVPENPVEVCNYRNRNSGGAFVPFKEKLGSGLLRLGMKEDKEVSHVPSLSLMPPMSELGGSLNSKSNHSCGAGPGSSLLTDQVKMPSKSQQQTQQQLQQQAFRKQRRCWSPELHRRFVDALQQLGGSHAATPKQIRELMQVEGLTNDEVKSHLQKYRLHVRKLSPSAVQGSSNSWMSQDQSLDNSKANHSQSGSPQGPLIASGSAKGLSSTGGDSMEAEEDDERSDGHSWKGGLRKAGEDV